MIKNGYIDNPWHICTTKLECLYPLCINYDKNANNYCCVGCNCDHTSQKQINKRKKK